MTPPILGGMAMRRFGTITLGMVIVFVVMSSIEAQDQGVSFTGKSLLSNCEDAIGNKQTIEAGLCIGQIHGIWRQLSVLSLADPVVLDIKELKICDPRETSLQAMIKVVIKYLEEHPERLHMQSTGLIGFALRDAFPCE